MKALRPRDASRCRSGSPASADASFTLSRPLLFLLPFLLPLVLVGAGCSVDGSFLDTRLFICEVQADCGESWSCLRATPYASDFCAPECSDACGGVCVKQGDSESCLGGCRILDDGSTSECQSADYDCIRISAETDEGICYPVHGCSDTDGCGTGEECLTALVSVFVPGSSGLDIDNLYCAPAPEDPEECPPRSVHTDDLFINAPFRLCLPTCDAADTRCPPVLGCLSQFSGTAPAACIPGIYGVPCDDDSNCLLGTCQDLGSPGNFCTTTCDEADRLAFGCENLSQPLVDLGLRYRLECDPAAGGGVGGGLCSPRYEIGQACTEPTSDTFKCAEGLECTEVGNVAVCTTRCSRDEECNDPPRWRQNFCSGFLGVCLPQLRDGAECGRDGQCVSNVCEDGMCAG